MRQAAAAAALSSMPARHGASASEDFGPDPHHEWARPSADDRARSMSSGAKAGPPRPRGASESGGERLRPRMWFSRKQVNASSSALSDDEDDGQPSGSRSSGMLISWPTAPLDGRPIKSANPMADIAELYQSGDSSTNQDARGTIENMAALGMTSTSSPAIPTRRPVTPPPPNTRSISLDECPTPLSPFRRNPPNMKARKSPRIAPLVFSNTPGDPPALPDVMSTFVGSPRHGQSAKASPATASEPTFVPPSPGRSSLMPSSRRPSNESTSSLRMQAGTLGQPFSDHPRVTPPRSFSSEASMTSARSTPSPVSVDLDMETEELNVFDEDEDWTATHASALSGVLSKAQAMTLDTKQPQTIRATGYTVEVVCIDNRQNDDDEQDSVRWEITIKKDRRVDGRMAPRTQTSPVALTRGLSVSAAPATASSINLSLAIDRPTGKLAFISLPTDPQATPNHRPRPARLDMGRADPPDSPSPSTQRFQAAMRTSDRSTTTPTSPYFANEARHPATALSPPPPLTASPNPSGRFPLARRTGPTRGSFTSSAPTPAKSHFADSPRLLTPRSPPASPRELSNQRRKVSLQDGVLFGPDL